MPISEPEWYGWVFDEERLVLEQANIPGSPYEVDLEQTVTSAGMLDWIVQVTLKTWATPEIVKGLVRALHDTLDPQATLCSMGVERGPIEDVRAVTTHVLERRRAVRKTMESKRRSG